MQAAEKELRDLVKEIGKYDDDFRSVIGSEVTPSNLSISNDLIYPEIPNKHTVEGDEHLGFEPQEEKTSKQKRL